MPAPIDPGKLNRRVTILMPGAGKERDSYGTVVPNYGVLCGAWASIEPLKPSEVWQALMSQARITKMVTIRYRPGITAQAKVVHGGVVMNVVGPPKDPEERHEWLILQCCEPG